MAQPEWIGRYRVREVIGTGAFATVYRATDEHLDADVAVKVLAENHSLDPDVRKRFIEEGRRLRRLRSPHLVAVYDLGDTERAQPYLVMEWADRGDLASRVAHARGQGRPPGSGDVLAVAQGVAAALGVLHRDHVVHRDLAPANLLLGSTAPPAAAARPTAFGVAGDARLIAVDERLMLSDLGLSKDLAAASGLTVAAGTSGFAPPEQRSSGGTVDQRADVWAASALLVWLMLDRPPDEDGTWRRDLRNMGWPGALAEALDRGLAKRPHRRQAGIDAWCAAVEDALKPAAPVDEARAPANRRSGGSLWLIAALVVALLIGGVIGAVVTRPSGGPAVRAERLEGGGLRTIVEAHGVTIALEGPTEMVVGEPVRLTADVTGTDTWQWVGPDGAVHPNQTVIELTPGAPGSGTARVLAFDDQGRVVEATHSLRVSGDVGS